MLHQQVYLVGPRYQHHASRSGYESFQRYIGIPIKSPVMVRFLSGRLGKYRLIGDLGWRIDQAVSALTPRTLYSLGTFLIEAGAGWHMLTHRRSLYHVLYGDSDVLLLSLVSRITGNRLVATFHDPPPILDWMAIDKVAPKLDAVILVSESQRVYFENLLPKGRIFVVPHGIDTDFFRPAERLSHEPICITAGSKLRDFETLEQTMKLIWQVNPNVCLIAVGTHRPKDSNPKFQLDDKRVRYLDGVSDEQLLQAYQTARVAIFSLRDATANNALLEAMACGLPIVSTDVGGIREYLCNEAGLFSLPNDPEGLATSVLRLLEDELSITKMSLASRERALEFNYGVVAERLRQVYSEIMLGTSN